VIITKDQLTEAARVGYTRAANPHLYSSPMWYAHELGRYFDQTGRPSPRDVRMGRGYSIRASDMRFMISGTAEYIRFERVE
jgi:hypothetical protein